MLPAYSDIFGNSKNCYCKRGSLYRMIFLYIKIHLGISKTVVVSKCHIIRCHFNCEDLYIGTGANIIVFVLCPSRKSFSLCPFSCSLFSLAILTSARSLPSFSLYISGPSVLRIAHSPGAGGHFQGSEGFSREFCYARYFGSCTEGEIKVCMSC